MSTEAKKKAKYLKRVEKGKKGIKPKAKKSPKKGKVQQAQSPKKQTATANEYAVLHGEREAALSEVRSLRMTLARIKDATEGSRWKEAKLAHELASEALAD